MYFGAKIKFGINFEEGYPFSPPKIAILTPIFHPNIMNNHMCIGLSGECLVYSKNWNPSITIK